MRLLVPNAACQRWGSDCIVVKWLLIGGEGVFYVLCVYTLNYVNHGGTSCERIRTFMLQKVLLSQHGKATCTLRA